MKNWENIFADKIASGKFWKELFKDDFSKKKFLDSEDAHYICKKAYADAYEKIINDLECDYLENIILINRLKQELKLYWETE